MTDVRSPDLIKNSRAIFMPALYLPGADHGQTLRDIDDTGGCLFRVNFTPLWSESRVVADREEQPLFFVPLGQRRTGVSGNATTCVKMQTQTIRRSAGAAMTLGEWARQKRASVIHWLKAPAGLTAAISGLHVSHRAALAVNAAGLAGTLGVLTAESSVLIAVALFILTALAWRLFRHYERKDGGAEQNIE